MEIELVRRYLDDFHAAEPWLARLAVTDRRRAHGNLVRIATSGITLDLLAVMADQLTRHLPRCPDADMALNNLDHFVAASRNPLAVGTLFQRDPEALPTLIQICSTSQHLSDLLIADPGSYDLLRMTAGQPVARQYLVDELCAEVAALAYDEGVMRTLRQFKRREILRIAYGDIVRQQSVRTVTAQISYVADAVLEAALQAAWRKLVEKRGVPRGPHGQPARFVVVAMGKLGGVELNYSSDVDLLFLYDHDGTTDGRRSWSNAEFFDRLAREYVRLLTEPTELGSAYRVDLRLRPEGRQGPIARTVASALEYYDSRGRTWERQAFIKARPVAGDLDLGYTFLEQLQPWIYRRYLSQADISGIKALKRRIDHRVERQGTDARNVKTGLGGIRDVEFVIQFLQLVNGGDQPEVRTGNTLEAIARLEKVGCLTNLERSLLEANYSFLRKIEHRLQIMFDLQTHTQPEDREELRKLALRMGYTDSPSQSALEAYLEDYRSRTRENRRILDHLLQDAFADDVQTAAEVDLVLDPDPPEDRIVDVLRRYAFRDPKQAYHNLMSLAEERIRFLSTRRCRLFLASIAPQLLRAIAETPDPDATLVQLDKVSGSLGGKGVLWELFSFHPPSLRLCVELCAYSPFLAEILITNPGMLDGLMDSLMLDKLPAREAMEKSLAELCRAAEDLDPILHSFKNDHLLRVGARDLLGKEEITAITRSLSDIAETCLAEIAAREYEKLIGRFGVPMAESGPAAGQPSQMAVLALGKLGGQELNYHSDLDIIFLYEADGHTADPRGGRTCERTTNQHFFSEWGQRIIKATSHLSAYGRLYQVDVRLRPTGRSGALATSLDEFARYFAEEHGQLWERQALCKARVVVGPPRIAQAAREVVARAAFDHPWHGDHARQIRQMRGRLEQTVAGGNLKRGPGGIVDIEFLVQMLQRKYGRHAPEIRCPNTLQALRALHEAGYLAEEDFQFLSSSYRFLRTLESRLRLTSLTPRDQLPDDPKELAKLAHLMRSPTAEALQADCEAFATETRKRFDRIFDHHQR